MALEFHEKFFLKYPRLENRLSMRKSSQVQFLKIFLNIYAYINKFNVRKHFLPQSIKLLKLNQFPSIIHMSKCVNS